MLTSNTKPFVEEQQYGKKKKPKKGKKNATKKRKVPKGY